MSATSEAKCDHEAERRVLWALLYHPSAYVGVLPRLRAEHFDHVPHQIIYQAILDRYTAGVPIDDSLVRQHLEEAGKIGVGPAYDVDSTEYEQLTTRLLDPNYDEIIGPAHIAAHAETVIKLWTDRRLYSVSAKLAEAVARGQREKIPALLEEARKLIEEATGTHNASGTNGRRSYPLLTDLEVEAFEPAKGIVGDILFEDSIAYLFADSDTWKTFLAASWCGCVATGTPWLGRKVQQGPAIFVPAEGARGFGKRLTAWKMHHGFAGQSIDFFTVPMAVNLLDKQSVPTLIDDIRAHPRLAGRTPALIVFDTLASSMDGGDENDTSDANRVTAAVRSLKQAFGCCVLLLHHSGNAYTHRMRGNSAFRNNSDTTIQVIAPPLPEGQKRQPGDVVTIHSNKAKDDAGFEDIHITTKLREWARPDGTPVSSLVVVETDQKPAARGESVIMPQSSQDALKVLAAAGEPLTASQWERAYGPPRRTFYNARDDLEARQYVQSDAPKGTKGARYSLTEAGRNVLKTHGATVQGECKNGATAPSDLTENGASDGVAPFRVTDAETPEFMGSQNGAIGAGGIYTSAPLHLRPGSWPDYCPKAPTKHHEYNGKINGLGQRICIGCGEPEAQVSA